MYSPNSAQGDWEHKVVIELRDDGGGQFDSFVARGPFAHEKLVFPGTFRGGALLSKGGVRESLGRRLGS